MRVDRLSNWRRLALTLLAAPLLAATPAAARETDTSGPALAELVEQVEIPFETFTLDNGLVTIVHTDRKAPLVGVTVYYRVGSRHEPRGRTGFAHLFEHLMFGGSENVTNFDVAMEAAGSTPTNGSTSYDRTNYVATVPTGALDLALFLESDRMGHLLGAVTQDKLDRQRGVVKNEKRQSDIEPFGLVDYTINAALLPVGHPYRHSVVGSMADLDAASLADVRDWFADHYAPNNVVLALAGDIDLPTARAKVERWFGGIPRGRSMARDQAGPVTLAAPVSEVTYDAVAAPRLYRAWTGPGQAHPDAIALEVGMHILGGLYSSRLDSALVFGDGKAGSVYAYADVMEQLSFLTALADLTPGADIDAAERDFVAAIDRLLEDGPSEDEVRRSAMQIVVAYLGGLEGVGGFSGKGAVLAEGLVYAGDVGHYRKYLERVASLTPHEIRDAMRRWLRRPAYALRVLPGPRTQQGAELGGWGGEDTVEAAIVAPTPDATVAVTSEPARVAPEIVDTPPINFPEIERARLSNGIPVTLAQREAVPMVTLALTLDAGSAADDPRNAGRHQLMMDILEQGTTTRGPFELVIAQEELGATIDPWTGIDASRVFVSAPVSSLAQSLDIAADMLLAPGFSEEGFARVRAQRLTQIAEERTIPQSIAGRVVDPVLYGPDHPYALAATSGSYEVVSRLTREGLVTEHAEWVRPDLASFTVVGDIGMAQLLPMLEASFGGWQAPDTPRPKKAIHRDAPSPQERLVIVDRPESPQSFVTFARLLPVRGSDAGQEPLELANEVIGNGFLSRLNSDLREARGWTYAVGSTVSGRVGRAGFYISTLVQADRTGESIVAVLDQLAAFPATRPVEPIELQRVTEGNIRGLPNRFETNTQILGALLSNEMMGRREDYQESLPAIYRGIDAEAINAAAARYLHPRDMTIVVVGDRALIDAQLDPLGMPVHYVDPAGL